MAAALSVGEIARRIVREARPGGVVAASGVWADRILAALPGSLGVGTLSDAGLLDGAPLSVADAAAIARGGYIDLAVIEAGQVDRNGSIASAQSAGGLSIPGNTVDLSSGARRVVALLPNAGRDGVLNLVDSLSLPADGVNCVDTIICDVGVINVAGGQFVLTETAPGWTAGDLQAMAGVSLSVSPDLRQIDLSAPSGDAVSKVYSDGAAAVADLPDGATVFIDGFGGPGGMAHYLLVALRDLGSRGLTIVSNTAGIARVVSFGTPPGRTAIDHSVLIENGQVAKAIASFPVSPSVSRPSEFELAYRRGEVELELVPQGTLAERLRAGGAGVLAFYTPTGAGTLISEGKESRTIDGREYILEYGLRADYAIIRAHRADERGNLVYRGTSRNFNAVMAPAARITVAEVDEIVAAGELNPEEIVTPGVFVQRIVKRPDGFSGYE